MAVFDLRILLESVQGVKTSYISQSFVNTSNDLVLSSSQVFNRITGSVSCSYQNTLLFSGSEFKANKKFKDNSLLSASLSGSLESGSIVFTATTTEYDRLLRYKFFGEKVCNVLGLPHETWVYVDQVRLPADDEPNYIEGNIKSEIINVLDTLNFSNTANISSDVNFLIDTGSDKHIKFIDTRGASKNGLIFGYDTEKDRYEIEGGFLSSSLRTKLHGFSGISANTASFHTSIQSSRAFLGGAVSAQKDTQNRANSVVIDIDGNMDVKPNFFLSVHDADSTNPEPLGGDNATSINFRSGGAIVFRAKSSSETMVLSQSRVGIATTDNNGNDISHTLTINGNMTVSESLFQGAITASSLKITNNAVIDGDIISNRFITSESISVINTSSGSTAFGNTNDDVHQFTGSLKIQHTGSSNIGLLLSGSDLRVDGDISASGFIDINESIRLDNGKGMAFDVGGPNSISFLGAEKQIAYYSGSFPQMVFDLSSNNNLPKVGIGTTTPAKELTVTGDISASGELSANTIVVGSTITHIGDSNTKITFSDDDINLSAAGKTAIDITYDGDGGGDTREITFNEGHADIDVRIEGDTDANLFFTNAGTERVGIGTNSPTEKLSVSGSINVFGEAGHITASGDISSSATSTGSFGMGFFAGRVGIGDTPIDAPLEVHLGNTTQIISDRNGNGTNIQLKRSGTTRGTLSTNNTSGKEFEIFSSGDLIFNESNGDNVGIGKTAPTKKLEVEGDISASGDLLKTKFVQMTNSSSVIDTFNTSSFRSAKYVLQVVSASNQQLSEMLVLHHNATASNTEYAQINSGLNLINFTTDVSDSNVRLNANGSFISCSVRLDRIIIPT